LAHAFPKIISQVGLVVAWYAGNTLYNVYNKKATNSKCIIANYNTSRLPISLLSILIHSSVVIHAHWFVAAAQLVVGMIWSIVMWGTGMRKTPNLTSSDIAACIPIGFCACVAHAGSVLAVSAIIL
jgi:solute carrier family 35 protein E1